MRPCSDRRIEKVVVLVWREEGLLLVVPEDSVVAAVVDKKIERL